MQKEVAIPARTWYKSDVDEVPRSSKNQHNAIPMLAAAALKTNSNQNSCFLKISKLFST
jgi:hypothetical protein